MAAAKETSKRPPTSASSDAGAKGVHAETASNILKIARIEEAHKEARTFGEKLSEGIAAFCGSMIFVYVHIVFFGGWIILNSIPRFQFDPFPFTFLTLVVSLEAIFLSTFILISQNHETKLSERRNHLDLQINMLAEQENTKMLELLLAVADKVGVSTDDDAVKNLLEPMEPETMVEQILSATDGDTEKART